MKKLTRTAIPEDAPQGHIFVSTNNANGWGSGPTMRLAKSRSREGSSRRKDIEYKTVLCSLDFSVDEIHGGLSWKYCEDGEACPFCSSKKSIENLPR